jgi:hypothetical protein
MKESEKRAEDTCAAFDKLRNKRKKSRVGRLKPEFLEPLGIYGKI